jgi:parallel beta-helix repeat protein
MQMNIWKVCVVASLLAYTPANARHFGHQHAVNGVCGSADGVSTTNAPTTNLCSAGTATAVTDIGSWTWSCSGSNGGSTASCSAPVSSSGSGSGSSSGSASGSGGSAQDPGPSASLFNSPYYQCRANYYVSNSGSDSNNGSNGAPWATLQHADSMNVGAGACINVAPGTYDGVTVNNGGNAATSTGYVVYRCQTLDGCTITGNAGDNGSASVQTDDSHVTSGQPNTVNYVQFDGFVLAGTTPITSQSFGIGFSVVGDNGGTAIASHHVWLLNSIVHGFGQSGVQMNEGDYHYAIHNAFYDNSGGTQCGAQGSGWSAWEEHPILGYTPTADDQNNPVFGSWVVGSSFFHVVVEYNVVYNNAVTQCGSTSSGGDTDGNGIIFDTDARFAGNPTNYTAPMLAAFNIVYNNGGGGIHINGSSNVTVANNSCYNNWLDPANNATYRGCIDDNGGSGNTFINNIAVAVPTVTTNCSLSPPYTKFNNAVVANNDSGQPADTFSTNMTDMIGVGCSDEVNYLASTSAYPVPPNIESTNPLWVNVGTSSVGTESKPPVGTNFALSPGSPAIGAGLTEPYLPPSSVDIGACASALTTCP